MKKVFEFIKNLPKWVKAIIPITLLIILFTVGVLSSRPYMLKVFPADSIVSKRDESCGVFYNNRAFVSVSTMDKFSDATLKRVKVEEFVKYGRPEGENFYSIQGLDPNHVLLKRSYDSNLHIYLSLSETPYYKGKDLYENILKLSENTVSFNYMIKGQFAGFDYFHLNKKLKEKFTELFTYLNEADFMYKESVEEIKNKSINEPQYCIEAEFENGFVYSINLYDGGYVIPCGAGDICQKIPDKLYNEIKAILDDESSGEFVTNTVDYEQITNMEDVKCTNGLEIYLPSYIPCVIVDQYAGEIKVNTQIHRISANYGYDLETGRIEGADSIYIRYCIGLNEINGYSVEITKKSGNLYYETENCVKAEDFTLNWLKDNYESKKVVNEGMPSQYEIYSYHFAVDYGDVEVRIESSKLAPEEVYKIIKSIDLL